MNATVRAVVAYLRRTSVAIVLVVLALIKAIVQHVRGKTPVGYSFARLLFRNVTRDLFAAMPPSDLTPFTETMARAKVIGSGLKITPYKHNGVHMGHWLGDADYTNPGTIVHVYFHGGAYVALNSLAFLEMHNMLLTMAKKEHGRQIAIFSADYRLATEAPFPAQLEDALQIYSHFVNELKISPRRIVVGGDSAGGNLTLGLSLTLRDRHVALPAAIILVSPWVTMDQSAPSFERNKDNDMLDKEALKYAVDTYVLRDQSDNTTISPLQADLKDLPKALVYAGEYELFVDDITALVRKLELANGQSAVEYEIAPVSFHDYIVCLPDDYKPSIHRYLRFLRTSVRI